MTHNIDGIGDVFKVKKYDYDTLKKLYFNVLKASREKNEEYPQEIKMLIVTAGYALDFYEAVKLSNNSKKSKKHDNKMLDIYCAIIGLVMAEVNSSVFHTFNKDILIKKIASYLFFDFYNTAGILLRGFYLDIDQRQIVMKVPGNEKFIAVDAMKIAQNIVNNALLIDNSKESVVGVDGCKVSTIIQNEINKKRPINPQSYIFEE
jgi:hypothetical protein